MALLSLRIAESVGDAGKGGPKMAKPSG